MKVEINPDSFKMRASQAGILFTRGGVKSKTVQSYLQDWIKEQIYGVKKEFTSKYTEKGNKVEDEAINYAIQVLDLPFVMKNEKHFENEFFTGTPDLILKNRVIDVKSSWDCFTFPLFETMSDKIKNDLEPYSDFRNYFYQGQVYMHLTEKLRHTVAYCLMNTPEELEKETAHDYSNVPSEFRIKEFSFNYMPERIKQFERLVLACREELKELINKL